jgi:hypothetical protein
MPAARGGWHGRAERLAGDRRPVWRPPLPGFFTSGAADVVVDVVVVDIVVSVGGGLLQARRLKAAPLD